VPYAAAGESRVPLGEGLSRQQAIGERVKLLTVGTEETPGLLGLCRTETRLRQCHAVHVAQGLRLSIQANIHERA
jgi:hypothetical protein